MQSNSVRAEPLLVLYVSSPPALTQEGNPAALQAGVRDLPEFGQRPNLPIAGLTRFLYKRS